MSQFGHDLSLILERTNSFTLLLAPPAWGKTTLILDLFTLKKRHFLFISPLRALNMEFAERSKWSLKTYVGKSKKDVEKNLPQFFKEKRALFILTPELIDDHLLYQLNKNLKDPLIIFDEFHLFYYWGHNFRPIMWESLLGLLVLNAEFLAMTATFDEKILKDWKKEFLFQFDSINLINIGNQTLRFYPKNYFWYPTFLKKIFVKHFLECLKKKEKGKGTYLYFCRYRHEIDFWPSYLKRLNLVAIGCKGGDVPTFLKELHQFPHVDCIFATSTLSHGVNLPPISKVFISYPLKNIDFWIQMMARGGRDGSPYEVYSFDGFFQTRRQKFQSMLRGLIHYLTLRVSVLV